MEGERTEKRPDSERGYEIGMDEAWKANLKIIVDFIYANMKRTYDEYQEAGIESIKRNRSYVDKVLSDAQQFDNQRQTTGNHALELAVSRDNQNIQNAMDTANMVAKQSIRHESLAADRQWNVDEVAQLVAQTSTFKDAIAAAVANAVNDALAKKS